MTTKLHNLSQKDFFVTSDTQKGNPRLQSSSILEKIDSGIVIISNQLEQVFYMNKNAQIILRSAMTKNTNQFQSALALIRMPVFERCSFSSEAQSYRVTGTGKYFSITQLITDNKEGNHINRKSRIYKVSNSAEQASFYRLKVKK